MVQAWVARTQGFSAAQSVTIVSARVLCLGWMICVALVSFVGQSGLTKNMA